MNEKIYENLTLLEQEIIDMNDSFHDLAKALHEANNKELYGLDDFSYKNAQNKANDYVNDVKDYNDTVIKVETLKRAADVTGDPKILKNLQTQESLKKVKKAEKSNAYHEKVAANKKWKEEKRLSRMHESLEYENIVPELQALQFIQQSQLGQIDTEGNQVAVDDPAGIIQDAAQFEQSGVGADVEHMLYLLNTVGNAKILATGIGKGNPKLIYFYDSGNGFRVIDTTKIFNYDPTNLLKLIKTKETEADVIKAYVRNPETTPYQIFTSLDFLIGQPLLSAEELICSNWKTGLLKTPVPVIEQPEQPEEAVEEEMPEEAVEEVPQEEVAEDPNQEQEMTPEEEMAAAEAESPVDESALFWHEAENIPNNGANLSSENIESKTLQSREKIIDSKEENGEDVEDEREKLMQDSINEAKSPVDIAFSGETGLIIRNLLTQISTGKQELDYIAAKISESAVIKNLLYKYDRELKKINPDKNIISNLKLKLKSEITKYKKNK